MTYRPKEPWIPEEDLVLTKTLGQRIRYVRTNLVDRRGKEMTQPAFAAIVGLSGHHGVMRWEKGPSEPKRPARAKLAALTKGAYREEVFSRGGAEVLVVETAVPLLRELQAELAAQKKRLDESVEATTQRLAVLEGVQEPPEQRSDRPSSSGADPP